MLKFRTFFSDLHSVTARLFLAQSHWEMLQSSVLRPHNALCRNIGTLERRVTLSVLKERVQKEIEARLRRLAKKSRMPGFRPGKVPLKIVRSQHEKRLEIEVLEEYF